MMSGSAKEQSANSKAKVYGQALLELRQELRAIFHFKCTIGRIADMPIHLPSNIRLALTCALIASVVGFLVGKESGAVPDLRDEVARLEAELNQARLSQTKAFRIIARPGAAMPPVRPTAENAQPDLSLEQLREKLKREVIQRGVDAALATAAAENSAQYEAVLSYLGLAPEAIFQVQSNLVDLHKKAMTAGEPMGQLAQARADYDDNMRSLLGEDEYKRYRLFEASKPALREYEMLREYALGKRGWSLDPAEAPIFVDLMRYAGATTTVTWHGPYDPLPKPISGALAIEQMEADYRGLVEKANSLLESAVASGISDDYVQLLQDYYTDKTEEAYEEWVFSNKPFEEMKAIIDSRVQEELQKKIGN
jgi:hypothetical protein